jgi:Cu(I)/Ag(I) efflux system membrane protein CusA/SilA
MIERIIALSIRHRFLVILAGLVLALGGVFAIYRTPMDAIPDRSENQVIVFTEWPGHSPREIEDQVTYPLSLHLQGVAGVRVVRSSSDVNFSMIAVIFEDAVGSASARQRVAERLTRAGTSLPAGVVPGLAPDTGATGQVYWYTVEGNGYDLGKLRAVQDWYVRPQLSAVPGVAEVASVGGHSIEYHVDVDPLRLQAHGATLAEVTQALTRSSSAVGGDVIHQGNAELVVRGVGLLGRPNAAADAEFDSQQAIRDLENVTISGPGRPPLRVSDLATVALGSQPRRGVLEKDGNEVTGGVVLMRQGENPLEVTRRLRQKIQELQVGLPAGVHIVPFYDRTPLIEGAVGTVTNTVLEAILTATVCVLLVLRHFRTSFIIAVTLPLAVLASFTIMWALRGLGVADIQTNIMSLAGIAISIGVLVDSSIVMAENAMHHLKEHFGDRPVTGDIRPIVVPACQTVGRPIFFSVVIMLLSFLPVFALGGMEGKMFHPLAFAKSFALLAVALLAITLVPALCTIFIRGRLYGEMDSWLVRSVILAYRPVLDHCLSRPAALVWLLGVTFLLGVVPLGIVWWGFPIGLLAVLFIALVASIGTSRSWLTRVAGGGSLVLIALVAEQVMAPLSSADMTPLDEGMSMDMPITIPRASVTQSADDLKARDMIFCRFPEVDMVVGKAGRAETPTDPAPLDMIETMVNFRPPGLWPKRKLRTVDIERQTGTVLDALVRRGAIAPPEDRPAVINEAVMEVLPRFDAQMREYAYQRNQEFERELGPQLVQYTVAQIVALLNSNGSLVRPMTAGDVDLLAEPIPQDLAHRLAEGPALEDVSALARETAQKLTRLELVQPGADLLRYQPNVLLRGAIAVHTTLGGTAPTFGSRVLDAVTAEHRALWHAHVNRLNSELVERAASACTRLALEELLSRATVTDAAIASAVQQWKKVRSRPPVRHAHPAGGHHHHGGGDSLPTLDPQPVLDAIQAEQSRRFARWVTLWPKERSDLADFGGELDRVMQMPGWTNIWTMPIQNRVDMLSTGVPTAVGIRVLGRKLDDVVRASEDIAAAVKRVAGAADVIADPVIGKGYLEVRVDREKAARHGVNAADVNDLVETALGGKIVTQTIEGRERHPVRVRYPRVWCESEEAVGNLLLTLPGDTPLSPRNVPLSEVADVRSVEGPASIKSDNGLLRNYVKLNVRGRDAVDFVDEARRTVAAQVPLPPGVFVEWTGRFEHDLQARNTLFVIGPLVVGLIFLILYLTYHDLADAVLMVLAVPGALAGGVLFQWLFGYPFTVTVWVGYIACFGMATATGIIMLVYLREAVAKAGGLENMTLAQLRQAVLDGAVHRLRPKLLTECTTVIGLAPLLWATGTGADVIRPMVVPVLGGLLIADEVIDLFLPVLFYGVRRWRWHRLHGGSFPVLSAPQP